MDELDPRKLQELSESLNDLTGTVKYTGQAMQSMLGPQAEANKKLKQSGQRRADVEEAAAQQEEKQLSKREQAEAKQNKMFEDELRYRGYKLERTGALSKTTTELSSSQKQSLEALDKRINKERELAEVTKDPVKAFRNVSNSVNSLDGVMSQMQEKMFEMTGKSVPLAVGLTAATAVVGGVIKAATGMADALYKGERGAKVGAKAVKDLNDSVTKAAYGIGAALLFLPGLGIVAKVLGVVIAGFAAAMEGSTKLIEMGAKYNDDVYNSFNKLSEVGLTTAKGMSGVSNTMEKLGVTSAELEKMNALLASGSKDLALFGGTAASGLEKFTEVAGAISHPASELNKKLMLLGISSDEQREHTLKYMAQQTRMGMMQGKSQADLVKGATAYMEELDRIAAVTGIGRKEQEEAQKQVMAIEELRAAMYEAERTGDTKRQKELETAFKYSSRLMAEGRKKEAAGVAKYYAAGKNVVDQESAMAMQNSAGAIKAISEGKQGEDVYQAGIESAKESAKRTAGTKRIGGDVSGQIGDFNATLDAIKRSEKVQEEAKKLGISPEAYAKKLQKEKEEKPDPLLAKNVEAQQLQQKAGLLMDQAAKSMDGAGLAMASSVKAFNEAVKLFNQATTGSTGTLGATTEKAKKEDEKALASQQKAMDANKAVKNDPKATQAQKEAAQKAEDEANKESWKTEAKKREAMMKELDDFRKLNKERRAAGKEAYKNLAEAHAAGAMPKAEAPAAAAPAAPSSAPAAAAPKSDKATSGPDAEGQPVGGGGKAPDDKDKKAKSTEAAPTTAAVNPKSMGTALGDRLIANEPIYPDKPLSAAQMAAMQLAIDSGNKYSPELMEKFNKQKASKAAPVAPDASAKDTLPVNKASEGGIFSGPGDNSVSKATPVAPNKAVRDAILINKASEGGIFSGPGSASATLSGGGMAANEILTSIRDSFGQVQKKSVESELPKLTKLNTMATSNKASTRTSSMEVLEKFTEIMEQKLSDVIDAISDNNDLKEEILLYSKA